MIQGHFHATFDDESVGILLMHAAHSVFSDSMLYKIDIDVTLSVTKSTLESKLKKF